MTHTRSKRTLTLFMGLGLLAGSAYVAFGGMLAETSALEPETSINALAVAPANVGGVPSKERASGSSGQPNDHFPSGYVNLGGDGNVMTYEHD